ncbi:cysteine hydrolase family protein [Paenibacillus sp. Marseille-Q4541]|uniref:cysteine hydrolase family protein n=1 Tax=Paenibacillus sp. Marseille-Q4541 TaxID=2831522 RepID=UPI001BA7AFA0|nr:cysteine hydrolase family protein [Paenibacillus sp. Marseille-Q4541]
MKKGNQALIIIDLQEIFFRHEEYHLHQHVSLVSHVNELIGYARQQKVPVIFVQHTDLKEENELFKGKEDWKLYSGLDRIEEDPVFQKTKWDAFYKTDLLSYLQEKGIEQLIFAGAQTEFCLDTTIRMAYSLGYQNNIAFRDAHSTLSSSIMDAEMIIKHHENVWNNRFVTLHSMKDAAQIFC